MDFKKVTISLPTRMYEEAMFLIRRGLFSNFSDLVRSGIREELKDLSTVIDRMEDKLVYEDKELIKGVRQSLKDVRHGKFKEFKNEKKMDVFLDSL
jgi:Arc/MetJ-type ribon-helix-helix transcriptional regulator